MNVQKISLVIPAYNEEESLSELLDELENVLGQIPYLTETIIIDDGSSDSTWKVISECSLKSKKIKGIRLAKNYGQTQATQVGMENVSGEIVIVMDADGQNDPRDIPKLLEKVEQGYDVVSGWRFKRQDTLSRKLLSKIGNYFVRKISKVQLHDIGCSLKAYRKEVIKDFKILGEMHRIFPIYLAERGARVTEVKVNHRKREQGKSKYGVDRIIKLLLDLILYKFFSSYLSRPLYVFGGLGFFSIFISFLICLFVIYRKVFLEGIWLSPLFFISVTLFTIGVLFILLGIIAELLVRIYYQSKYDAPYEIKEKINF